MLGARAACKKLFFSLLGATRRRFWHLGALPKPQAHARARSRLFLLSRRVFADSLGAPGTCRGDTETLPRRIRNALGCHKVTQEPSRATFDSILHVPEPFPGQISDRLARPTSHNIVQCCIVLPNVTRYCTQLRNSAKSPLLCIIA